MQHFLSHFQTPSKVTEEDFLAFMKELPNAAVLSEETVLEAIVGVLTSLAEKHGDASAYACFLRLCRKVEISEDIMTETHHIIPKHAGGSDDATNLINLPVPLHILAHGILWKENNSYPDRTAFVMRMSISTDYTRVRTQEMQKQLKEQGKGFYNSDFQRELGKRGGPKGGSANTEAQFAARQKVGKEFGRQVGISNQSPELQAFLQQYCVWKFEGYYDETTKLYSSGRRKSGKGLLKQTIYIVTRPRDTMVEVSKDLQSFIPSNSPYTKIYELIGKNGEKPARNSCYGFSIVKTLTRSEVEAGALSFLSGFFYSVEDLSQFYKYGYD